MSSQSGCGIRVTNSKAVAMGSSAGFWKISTAVVMVGETAARGACTAADPRSGLKDEASMVYSISSADARDSRTRTQSEFSDATFQKIT
jgi:hypothetical protein